MPAAVVLERYPAGFAAPGEGGISAPQRKRVYIFPTAQGWLYGLMLMVMLLGAINYNNSMAYMLCFLLAALGLVGILHTHRNLRGLIIRAKRPPPVFAGQEARFPLHFDNRHGGARFAIHIERRDRGKRWFKSAKPGVKIAASLKAAEQLALAYPCPSARRGLLAPGRLVISSCFPLGLFNAWSYFEPDEFCLVYPRPQGRDRLPLEDRADAEARRGEKAGADDFAGFRKYRPGDSVNSIAWKAFARGQGLLQKQFSGEGSGVVILSWQSVADLDDIEARLSQLCHWTLLAARGGLCYGLELPGVRIEPASGDKHKARCLEQLARYGKPAA